MTEGMTGDADYEGIFDHEGREGGVR